MYVELGDQAVGRAVQRWPELRFRGHGRQGLSVSVSDCGSDRGAARHTRTRLLHTWLSQIRALYQQLDYMNYIIPTNSRLQLRGHITAVQAIQSLPRRPLYSTIYRAATSESVKNR